MSVDRRPLERAIARRFTPFFAIGALALLTIALPPRPSSWGYIALATTLSALIAAAGLLAPWSRMPQWTYLVPPLAYFVVIGLLRDAHGGSASGYAPLAILPVLWIALTLGRRAVAIGAAGAALLFLSPLLGIGEDVYTDGELRRAILWTAVSLVVGFAVEALVREVRTKARESEVRAAELEESERTMAAIARIVRDASASSDARALICRAALDVAEGTAATIVERDGVGWLAVTGSAGLDGRLCGFERARVVPGANSCSSTASGSSSPMSVRIRRWHLACFARSRRSSRLCTSRSCVGGRLWASSP